MLQSKIMNEAHSYLSGKWRVKLTEKGGWLSVRETLSVIQVERILSYHNQTGDYVETNFWENADFEALQQATEYVGVVDQHEKIIGHFNDEAIMVSATSAITH